MRPLAFTRSALMVVIGALLLIDFSVSRAARRQQRDRLRLVETSAALQNAESDLWNAKAEREKLERHIAVLEVERADPNPDDPAPEA